MSDNKNHGSRGRWIRPELKRLEAGAAETGPNLHADGGPSGNSRS